MYYTLVYVLVSHHVRINPEDITNDTLGYQFLVPQKSLEMPLL